MLFFLLFSIAEFFISKRRHNLLHLQWFARNTRSGACEEYRENFRITIYECSWFFRIRDVISSACSDMRWPRGTHTRSRGLCTRVRSDGKKERRETDGKEWKGQKLVQTFHFAARRACRERGLIFLFNSRNEIALVKSTGIFLFAMPSPLFLRADARP